MTESFTITFCGDTSLGYYYLVRLREKYSDAYDRLRNNPLSFFDGVRPLLEGSDEIIVNLETVLCHEPGQPIEGKKYPGCDDPDVTIDVLKKLGVTAVTLANNHTMDYGPDKLLSMIENLRSNGISTIGAGVNLREARRPYRIQMRTGNGVKNIYVFNGMRSTKRYVDYGFFAAKNKPGIASTNIDEMVLEIKSVKSSDPDGIVIVCPHWQGNDYKDVGDIHRDWCRNIIDSGADHVVAHGSHKADSIEEYRGGKIFFSIGNFVFNSPGQYRKKMVEPYSLVPRFTLSTDQEVGKGIFSVSRIRTDNKDTDFMAGVVKEKRSGACGVEGLSMEKNYYEEGRPFSTALHLSKELRSLGFTTRMIGGKLLVAHLGGESCTFLETLTSFTSMLGCRIVKDKQMARDFLERAGIKVSEGAVFSENEKERARKFVKNLGCVVIKPSCGNKGRGVSVNVSSDNFEMAWKLAVGKSNKKILIEKYFPGIEARYLVIDGKCVAVSMRIPPQVKGDGKRTIAELVDLENEYRKESPTLMRRPLKIDEMRLVGLKQRGHDLSTVLRQGEVVIIDSKANLSTGANSADITDKVHPSMKRVAEEAALAVPGLDIVGIDMIAINHSEEASEDNYIIVEVNSRPGIGGHHYPTYGAPRNVARDIALSVFEKMNGREAT